MPGPDESAATTAELARIQAERDALQNELDRIKAPRRRRFRRGIVDLLVALSCLMILLSTTVLWAHRTLLNTNAFVGTVGPVFQNPDVDSAVATRATDQLFTQLHLQVRLRDALPPKVGFAAVPITNATEDYVSAELAKVLGSSRFEAIWTQTLTTTHQEVVAVLRGKNTQTISTSGGYIVLNTVPVINRALGDVSGLASSLTGRNVTLPTITSAELPPQAVKKLSKALGVQLPSNFGQITLVRSNDLATVQRGVKAFDRLTIVLPLLTLALIAFTLWLSPARRRTLVQLLVASSLLIIVLRRVVIHEQGVLAGNAHNPQVSQSVLGDLLHGFFVLTAWFLGVALVILAAALLSGPYRWAVATRSFAGRTWHRAVEESRGDRRVQVVTWTKAHVHGLQLGGAVLAAILLLIVSVSWLSFLVIGALLAVYEVFLHVIEPSPPDGDLHADDPGHSPGKGSSSERSTWSPPAASSSVTE